MFLRLLTFLLIIVFCTSCDKFSFSKNTQKSTLDTIVDYSSVDTFPSFKECDSIIDKNQKSTCFRNTIHQKIGEELQKNTFTIKDSIDEVIYVDLLINSNGIFSLDSIQSSLKIKTEIPSLDSVIKASIKKLPKIFPANKRGIPVTTKYQLPIRIQLKD
ncbi:hypothetical protein [Polaribacter sp. Z022]|uniref:hypothetical protein n=1 Tax=Polaribacter sp. Z022 TaxID=2927125 RepID=UPI00202126BD|nr:hypothetical protein [Polaribacter sp. Z022]MCL7753637.1 hypothetical protein [Polaribacter sp. Z022]